MKRVADAARRAARASTTGSRSSSTPARRASCCRRPRAARTKRILDALDRLAGRRLDQRRRGHRSSPTSWREQSLHQGRRQPRDPRHRRRLQRRHHQPGRADPPDRGRSGETGVFLTVLGFGMGNLKDATMEKLADKGNGNYAYIDTLSRGAQGARRGDGRHAGHHRQGREDPGRVQPGRGRELSAASATRTACCATEDFNDDTKDAGEIGAGHTVTALYEVVPARRGLDGPRRGPAAVPGRRAADRRPRTPAS